MIFLCGLVQFIFVNINMSCVLILLMKSVAETTIALAMRKMTMLTRIAMCFEFDVEDEFSVMRDDDRYQIFQSNIFVVLLSSM